MSLGETSFISRLKTLDSTTVAVWACFFAHYMNHVMLYLTPAMFIFIPAIEIPLIDDQFIRGTISSASPLIITILSPAVGITANRFLKSRKWLIGGGLLTMGVAALFSSMAGSAIDLLFAAIIMGIGAAAYHPPGLALITSARRNQLDKNMAIHAIMGNFGTAFTPIVCFFIIVFSSNWRIAFLIYGILSVFTSLPYFLFLPTPSDQNRINSGNSQDENNQSDVSSPIWNRSTLIILVPLLFILVISATRGTIFRTLSSFTTVLMHDFLYLDFLGSALLASVILLIASTGEIITGIVVQTRIARIRAVWLSSILSGSILFVFFLFAPLFQSGFLGAITGVGLYAVLAFVFFLAAPAILAITADATKGSAGLLFGFTFSIATLVGAFAPMIFGGLTEITGSFAPGFLFLASMTLITFFAALALFLLGWTKKSFQLEQVYNQG